MAQEAEKKARSHRGQIFRSGDHGEAVITREKVGGMLRQAGAARLAAVPSAGTAGT